MPLIDKKKIIISKILKSVYFLYFNIHPNFIQIFYISASTLILFKREEKKDAICIYLAQLIEYECRSEQDLV